MQKPPEKKSKTKKKFDLSSIAILFLPIAFLLGIGGGYLIWGLGIPSANNPNQNSGGVFNPDGGDPFLGPEDAPITIVEFSDFQCPFCRRFYEDAYGQIKKDYIKGDA